MQSLSLMNGPTQQERDSKLNKEKGYRALLRQQMLEKQAEKEREKQKKKELQEEELRELRAFEAKNGKKIAHEKKVLAYGEFGGQGVKGMLYGGENEGGGGNGIEAQSMQPETSFTDDDEANNVVISTATTTNSTTLTAGGITSLLSKPKMEDDDLYLNPPQATAADNSMDKSLGKPSNVSITAQNPYSGAASAEPTNNPPVIVNDPALVERAAKFDQLETLYTDLLNSQKQMKKELEGTTDKMKKISERDKTLKAGQRGGLRRRRVENRKKPPERDKGGRIIRKKPPMIESQHSADRSFEAMFDGSDRGGGGGGGIPGLSNNRSNDSLLRSQSASRHRSDPINPYAKSNNQQDVLVSPSRAPRDKSRFGFKGNPNPRPSPHRNLNNSRMDADNKNSKYNANDIWDTELPTANAHDSLEASMGEPIAELGGSSDLLYNDKGLDPAHGSTISADQLDRLMFG